MRKKAALAWCLAILTPTCALDDPNGLDDVENRISNEAAIENDETLAEPADSISGIVERFNSRGELAESRTFRHAEAPENLGELLRTGKPDDSGNVFLEVEGAYGDGTGGHVRYRVVRRGMWSERTENERDGESREAAPAVTRDPSPPRVSQSVAAVLESGAPSSITVYLKLQGAFRTSLAADRAPNLDSFIGAEELLAERRSRIAMRKEEAETLTAPFVKRLEELGASDIHTFWTSVGVEATVSPEMIRTILGDERVIRIAEVSSTFVEYAAVDSWDGFDMNSASGYNKAAYHDLGYHGQAFVNNPGGRYITIGVIGGGMSSDLPIYVDCPGCGNRIDKHWDCTQNPCVQIPRENGTNGHAAKVASLALGSIRQNQVPGFTDAEELERTGMVEEASGQFFNVGSACSGKRAFEQAIDEGIDVVVSSTGWVGGVECDGFVDCDIHETAYEMQSAGTILVWAGGNKDGGTCTDPDNQFDSGNESLSAISVPPLGEHMLSCTSANYGNGCQIASWGARGGMDVTVNGILHAGEVSGQGLAAAGCPYFWWGADGTLGENGSCGSSWAAPQVGGAAAMVKDYWLDNGFWSISVEGRLALILLSMGDRASGPGTYHSTGYDVKWGAGRMQMRRLDAGDLGGPYWGWETWSHVFSGQGVVKSAVHGAGPEPSALNQFKVNTMVFEIDPVNIGDHVVEVSDNDCNAGGLLGQDISYDVKKMVRLDHDQASNKPLCVELSMVWLPPGETRRVHVFDYYSQGTSMR